MNGTLNLYLMRHGETILNKANRTQGWCDGVLTEEGKEIAKKVGVALKDVTFKSVYSSDLGRAIKTAQIIISENKYCNKLKLIELEGLREVCFGKYEGEKEDVMLNDMLKYLNVETIEEACQKYEFQKAYCDSCSALDDTNLAEDYRSALNRAMNSINIICKENYLEGKNNNVLIITHGGLLRLIIDNLDKSFDIRNISNSSVSKIVFDGQKLIVKSVNEMNYL